MAKISDLLARKDSSVFSISSKATVLDAIRSLAEHNIGALVVVEDGKPAGILSERDIVREARRGCARLERLGVADLMSKNIIIGLPSDELSYVMKVMTQNHIRHLPVMSEHQIVGLVSIGDVVKAQVNATVAENHMLRDYIEGKYPA